MIVKDIIKRIEGEAVLHLSWDKGLISDAVIEFPHFRGFEKLLEGRVALDALALTPRVCGICGQAHVAAAINALENLYKANNITCEVSPKAKAIRDFCTDVEILQSHIKWLFLAILPEMRKITGEKEGDFFKSSSCKRVSDALDSCGKMIALFGGQYPHTSFWVPGGVMCDPTVLTVIHAKKLLKDVGDFVDEMVFSSGGGAQMMQEYGKMLSLDRVGFGCKRYLALGMQESVDETLISETLPLKGHAKTARYGGLSYEVGALARKKLKGVACDDSALGRMEARIEEIVILKDRLEKCFDGIDLAQPSYIAPRVAIEELSGSSVGCVEAARGSLTHHVTLQEGIIQRYDMITPTVWNLGDRDEKSLGVCQEAMIGLESVDHAMMVLRSFDVCAVCTTH